MSPEMKPRQQRHMCRARAGSGGVGRLDENALGDPIAKENGGLAEYFSVKGIPAAAMVMSVRIVGPPGRSNRSR